MFGRRSLSGSAIGGIAETQEMLDFCGKHNITADVEVIPIQKVNEAYERLLKVGCEVPLLHRHGVSQKRITITPRRLLRDCRWTPRLVDSSDAAHLCAGSFADRVEICDHFGRKLQRCSVEILAKMFDGGCAGDQQDVGRTLKKPRQCDLHGRGLRVTPLLRRALTTATDVNPPSGKNGT